MSLMIQYVVMFSLVLLVLFLLSLDNIILSFISYHCPNIFFLIVHYYKCVAAVTCTYLLMRENEQIPAAAVLL